MSDTGNQSAPTSEVASESTVTETQQIEGTQENDSQPVPKMSKRMKIKVDAQEFDEELPFEFDENNKAQVDYIRRHLQMSKAASKRMQEAAVTRKQAEQFLDALNNDPMRVLSNPKIMGEDKFREIAEAFLSKKLQEQMLSPEERSRLEKEDRLRKYEEQEKQRQEAEQSEKIQRLQEHYTDHYQKVIVGALEGSNLPKNPFTVKRMAELMQKNLQYGMELEPSTLAQLVREDYQKELVALIGSSNPEQILGLFGEEVSQKIRKHDLEKLKAGNPGFGQRSPHTPNQTSNPAKPMNRDEWKAMLDKRSRE